MMAAAKSQLVGDKPRFRQTPGGLPDILYQRD
jgi:hypothetical protein